MLKLKIRSKMLAGFLVIVFLTCIMGFISYNSVRMLSSEIIPVIKANERIDSQMLNLRKNEKDFLARSVIDSDYYETGQSKYLDDFNSNYEDLQKQISIVKAFSTDSESQANFKEMERLVVEYKNLFYKVVEYKKIRGFKDWGKEGELRSAVHDIEALLDDENTYLGDSKNIESKTSSSEVSQDTKNELMILMLQMRRAEKDFFIRNDLTYRDKLNGLVDKFNEKVTSSDLKNEIKLNILSLIDTYKIEFNEVVGIMVEIGLKENEGIMGQYRETINQLEPLILTQAQTLVNQANNIAKNTNRTVMLTIVFIILSATFFAFFLAQKISSPLQQLTKAGNQIAEGNLDIALPRVKTGDEVQDISETMNLLIGALKFLKKESENKKVN